MTKTEPAFTASRATYNKFGYVTAAYLCLIGFFAAGTFNQLPTLDPHDLTRQFDQAMKSADQQPLTPTPPPVIGPSPVQTEAGEMTMEEKTSFQQMTQQELRTSYGAAFGVLRKFIPALDERNWWRQAFMTIGLVTTSSFFIGWLNRWFRQHVDAEFGKMQYAEDMERAKWIQEIVANWGKDRGPIPDSLIDRLSAHLFDRSVSDNHPATPFEALSGFWRGAKIKAADIEISMPRRRRPTDNKG